MFVIYCFMGAKKWSSWFNHRRLTSKTIYSTPMLITFASWSEILIWSFIVYHDMPWIPWLLQVDLLRQQTLTRVSRNSLRIKYDTSSIVCHYCCQTMWTTVKPRRLKGWRTWETKSILTELPVVVLCNIISRINLHDKYCLLSVNRKIASCSIECLKNVTTLTVRNPKENDELQGNIIPWRPFVTYMEYVISLHPNLESFIVVDDGNEKVNTVKFKLNLILEQCQGLTRLESEFSCNIRLSLQDDSVKFMNLTHLKLSIGSKEHEMYLTTDLMARCPNLVSLDACILPCCNGPELLPLFPSGITRLLLHFHSPCYNDWIDPSPVFSSPAMSTVEELSLTGRYYCSEEIVDSFQATHLTSLWVPRQTLQSLVSSLKSQGRKLQRLAVICDAESEVFFEYTQCLEVVCLTNISTGAVTSLVRNNCYNLREVCLSTQSRLSNDIIVTILSQCDNIKVLTIGPKQLPSDYLLNFVQDRSLYSDVDPLVVTFTQETEWMGQHDCNVMYITTPISQQEEEGNWWSSTEETKSCNRFRVCDYYSWDWYTDYLEDHGRIPIDVWYDNEFFLHIEEKYQRETRWHRKNQGRRKEKKVRLFKKYLSPPAISDRGKDMGVIRSGKAGKKKYMKRDKFQGYHDTSVYEDSIILVSHT